MNFCQAGPNFFCKYSSVAIENGCDKSDESPYTYRSTPEIPKCLFVFSDFLKGIELLLLGCFKVIMHTPNLSWSVAGYYIVRAMMNMPDIYSLKPDPNWPTLSDREQGGTFLKKTIIQGWVDFRTRFILVQ